MGFVPAATSRLVMNGSIPPKGAEVPITVQLTQAVNVLFLRRNTVSEASVIPIGYKYLSDLLGYCLSFCFSFPCLSDPSRGLLQKCQKILVLYNGGVFSSLGHMSFHREF